MTDLTVGIITFLDEINLPGLLFQSVRHQARKYPEFKNNMQEVLAQMMDQPLSSIRPLIFHADDGSVPAIRRHTASLGTNAED